MSNSDQPAPPAVGRLGIAAGHGEVAISPVLVLVLWLSCAVVGGLGLALSYRRPARPATAPPPVLAQVVEVQVDSIPLAPPNVLPSLPAPLPSARLPAPLKVSEAPPLVAVAAPSPAIAFALPVEGPTRVVAPAEAAYVRPPAAVVAPPASPPVQPLTFGQGEGRQPAPEYPRAAVRAGQEGTVRIGFTVAEDGRVVAAGLAAPSPWPLLNEAALNTVHRRWRFGPGAMRRYEVTIQFQLQKSP